MEAKSRLDRAVFQLTPTRTRCDLVAFSGKKSEKLASGLLEPFLSHLKYAKDQISKGGYSIILKPATIDASWFTKATLERFVRFVSTPEVLERFVTIEKEITQIESSFQSNEQINAAYKAEGLTGSATSSKIKAESNGSDDTEKEENSKVHLHRALETRKAVLRKEQAMAYARALAAGFEIDCLDDLLSFADTFGALRLREACITFMDLCNKKNEDRLWMDEIAAMKAYSYAEYPYLRTSGVILAGEDNDADRDIMTNAHVNSLSVKNQSGLVDASASGSTTSTGSFDANQGKMHSTDGKAQMPMWANIPQYVQNFQGPIFPHMASYQGHHLPGMQGSPFYAGNMPRPSYVENPGPNVDQESFPCRLKKEKFSNGKGSHSSQRDDSNEDDVSSTQSHSDDDEGRGRRSSSTEKWHTQKNARSSARKVVIRNINYITSERRSGVTDDSSLDDSSREDEIIEAESLGQQVKEGVGSLGNHHQLLPRSSKKQGGSKKHSNKSNYSADQDVDNGVPMNPVGEKRNDNWNIFQDLLLRDAESRSTYKDSELVQEAHVTRKSSDEQHPSISSVESENKSEHRPIGTDFFLLTERHTHNEGSTDKENNVFTVIKRGAMDEELLHSSNLEQSGNISQVNRTNGGNSIIKGQKGEDWLIFNQEDKSASQGRENITALYSNKTSTFVYDHLEVEENKKDPIVDDSLMVQDRSISELPNPQRETEIFTVSDITGTVNSKQSIQDNLQQRFESIKASEPDDLHVVLVRHSSAEQFVASWNPEMDYVNEGTLVDTVKRRSDIEQTDSADKVLETVNGTKSATDKASKGKAGGKETKPKTAVTSPQKSKSEMMSRSKKSPSVRRTMTQKDKAEKEEESRKKMEELLMQRQRRIAERSAAKGPNRGTSIKQAKESKAVSVSSKIERPKLMAANEEKKKLYNPVMRSSTIERLSAPRTTSKQLLAEPKARQPKKLIKEENGLSKKTATRNKKLSQDNVKSSYKKTETIHSSENASMNEVQEKTAKGPNTATSNTKAKESKAVAVSSKIERPKVLAANEEKKKLYNLVMRSSTIERLSAPRTTSKQLPAEPKARQTKKFIKEENALSKKTAGTWNKTLSQNNVKSSHKKTETIHSSESANINAIREKNRLNVMASIPKDSSSAKANQPSNVNGDFQNINESHIVPSVDKNESEIITHKDALDEKIVKQRVSNEHFTVPADVRSTRLQYSKVHNEEMPEMSCAKDLTGTDDGAGVSHKTNIHPSPLTSDSRIDEDGMGRKKFPVSHEILVTKFSTRPPGNEMNHEPSHSKKKWNGGENVPNFTKGIRKLLFFGRRS